MRKIGLLCILCIANTSAALGDGLYCFGGGADCNIGNVGEIINQDGYCDGFGTLECRSVETNDYPNYYFVYDCDCPNGYTKVYSNIGLCTSGDRDANRRYVSGCQCNCDNCPPETTTTNGAYITIQHKYCDCGGARPQCTNSNVTYKCAANYYGSAQMTNGTLTGCTRCPANASCPAGSTTFLCNQGYYQNGDVCTRCPADANGVQGTTKSTGAKGVTECYIPKNTESKSSNNKSSMHGTFKYLENCKHK